LAGSAQPQLQARLVRAQELADESIEEARQSVWALRGTPALVIAPMAAIVRMVRTLVEASALALSLDTDGESAPMDGSKHQELARLVREAVVNVLRHARATQLRLRIRADRDSVMISVSDDGCGFDVRAVSARSMGVRGMHERAERIGATLIVRSEAQVGTEVVIVINGQT
jgi:signal transduction histidine kinase